MGPMGIYLIYGRDGKQLGGMMNKPKEMPMPPVVHLLRARSTTSTRRSRAPSSMGAKVLNGPMEVPGGARIVQLLDPQGAAFALHEQATPAG